MIYTLIFSVIGLALGGLGGAFGGFLIGSIFDSIRNMACNFTTNRMLNDYCKQYFQQTFPHSDISQLMLKFRDILNSSDTDSACREACEKIRQYATVHEKIAVLQCLFGFATADGNAHQKEVDAIRQIVRGEQSTSD